jgi:hypothetical protein
MQTMSPSAPPFQSVNDAVQAWAVTATGDRQRQELFTKIVKRLMVELEQIERGHILGRTTIAIWHPEGIVRKAYLNDRQV